MSLSDSSVAKARPDEWTRENAAGETFHTYADPDRFPAWAKVDELLWRLRADPPWAKVDELLWRLKSVD